MLPLRQKTLISFLAFAILFVAGHAARADDKVGSVEGKVTLKGQPLADGKIIFHLDNGQFVGCKIRNGDYKIDQVPCGTRKVSVEGRGIPAKYASDDSSALSVEITGGRQSFDVVLND